MPKHKAALSHGYAHYLELNGGIERCGICGAEPKPGKRLHRDHEHKGDGTPRGLLCFRCNAALRPYMDRQWLSSAARYLERAA